MYHVHNGTLSSLIKQQFAITHTIHHTDIHTLLDSLGTPYLGSFIKLLIQLTLKNYTVST